MGGDRQAGTGLLFGGADGEAPLLSGGGKCVKNEAGAVPAFGADRHLGIADRRGELFGGQTDGDRYRVDVCFGVGRVFADRHADDKIALVAPGVGKKVPLRHQLQGPRRVQSSANTEAFGGRRIDNA
ncbi:hypothetical protein HS99_0024745 [Kitasatospora aureofaciens]|uniref:Uncharacterized protein n=1 Tax=Kitasatospora aureofaciens TaxID=1894 RepID=A0A1E7NAT4_KITAU|nr:hypothetical protein B6264_03250 [Kitasatospora aureofaciens]OEV37802.1 hypothetical protein HS99_0024745 [Kitasatospora aureofaciens]